MALNFKKQDLSDQSLRHGTETCPTELSYTHDNMDIGTILPMLCTELSIFYVYNSAYNAVYRYILTSIN